MFKPLTEENVKDFKNFKYNEFKCHCKGKYCNGYPVSFSYDLASNLQNIRSHFNKAVIITSAIRCQKWNDSLKGSVKNSLHTKGKAVDFYVKGISYKTLLAYVKKLPYFKYSYNISGSVMHYSINPPEYIEKYNLTRVLKKGCKGSDVKELQLTLGGLTVDGVFGDKTEARVMTYQKAHKLTVDGVVAKQTAHSLGWLYKGK